MGGRKSQQGDFCRGPGEKRWGPDSFSGDKARTDLKDILEAELTELGDRTWLDLGLREEDIKVDVQVSGLSS